MRLIWHLFRLTYFDIPPILPPIDHSQVAVCGSLSVAALNDLRKKFVVVYGDQSSEVAGPRAPLRC